MAVSLIRPLKWDDEEFKKIRDNKGFVQNTRLKLAGEDPRIETCILCGTKFVKKHHSEKYCGDDCREVARSQQSRNKAHRWYHRHKHELSEKQRWGLGSGTLGAHSHDDFEKEQSVIEKEFQRLRLKRDL